MGSLVNRTIDNRYGDEKTRASPTYLPRIGGVWEDETCGACALKPNASLAFNNSYISATYHPNFENISVSFDFIGNSVYFYFTLVDDPRPEITSNTECNFTIDGEQVGYFRHDPDRANPKFLYQQLVYYNETLEHGPHHASAVTYGLNYSAFLSFDFARYTVNESLEAQITTSSRSSPTSNTVTSVLTTATSSNHQLSSHSALIGGILGGVIALLLVLCIAGWLLIRGRRRAQQHTEVEPPGTMNPNTNSRVAQDHLVTTGYSHHTKPASNPNLHSQLASPSDSAPSGSSSDVAPRYPEALARYQRGEAATPEPPRNHEPLAAGVASQQRYSRQRSSFDDPPPDYYSTY
ncbi:hypothetical protein AMATHDRAFT_46849 [Amanita thiersii Skay4041]|uniref:Uncharacterized protein n=1 Tax=Amanita thiersii Skay4041 TaxID=703135 RepID=A0A2A9NVH4_9AGAR|nr:hypothetical protein AMATHDRAFT_46849 [Amanita thiersii Skay4041]